MAYTRPWDNATPVGGSGPTGTPANQSDDFLRNLREDFQQRMNDLVGDWFADPVTIPGVTEGIQFAKRYNYDTTGPTVTFSSIVKAMLLTWFKGTTDGAGDIFINLNEYPVLYDINDQNLNTKIPGILYDSVGNDFVFTFLSNINVGTRVITWNVRKADGSAVTNRFVQGDILLFFNNPPV